jgi:hypothetical protein
MKHNVRIKESEGLKTSKKKKYTDKEKAQYEDEVEKLLAQRSDVVE